MARRFGYGYGYGGFPPYVSAAEKKANIAREIARRKKNGETIDPISPISGAIAKTFWAKAWCANLESYSDYANRLPRGRTYVRGGAVIHLVVGAGKVDALVQGSDLYEVEITIDAIAKPKWERVVAACAGKIDSLVELLQGKLSKAVMEIVTDREQGLFPAPSEIDLQCSCPDGASMCKHVAAALYGVGARFDARPELLFLLRKVDHLDLVATAATSVPSRASRSGAKRIAESELSSMFGIEIDLGAATPKRRGTNRVKR
jgi:uncharacterized Zn finger protein